jgi:hypothetical protein
LAALQIAAEQRQPTESLHSEASRIAAYIEGNFERYMHPVAWFHDWEGDQEGAVRCWAKGVANYPGSADFVRHQYVAFLCRLGKLDDALAEANAGVKPVGPYTEIARALVLAEFSERHSEAVGACQTLVRSGYSLDVRTFALQALMLLGEDQMALVESRRMLDDADELNDTWLCKSVIELVAGRVRADELLQRAGPLRSNLVRAHFALGIERLAAGSRPEAQRHFQACVDSGIFVANQFQWAKAFLARMQHPEWPGWIAKESTGP